MEQNIDKDFMLEKIKGLKKVNSRMGVVLNNYRKVFLNEEYTDYERSMQISSIELELSTLDVIKADILVEISEHFVDAWDDED